MKLILLFFLFITFNTLAKTGSVTKLDIPRFVSLKSNDINLRIGPSINYPIELNYIKKNLPIEVIEEFDVWRKIKDHESNTGWLHKSLIKGERFILTMAIKKEVLNRPNGKKIGLIKKNNILKLNICIVNWCNVTHTDIEGWITKKEVWGIYKKETYNVPFYHFLIIQYWNILDSNLF